MANSGRFSGKIGEEYRLFKKSVPHYDAMQALVGKKIRRHIGKSKKMFHVLEIGFGTGLTTKEILNADKRIVVTSLDNEPLMLRYAKKILRRFIQEKRLVLVESDALAYLKKMPPHSIDAVGSCFTIHNFGRDYRRKLFAEIYRVLSPRGLFVNSDKCAFDNPVAHKAALEWQFEQYIRAFVPIHRQDLIAEWMIHDLEDEKVMPTETKTIRQLKKAGFRKAARIFRKQIHATIVAVK